MECWEKTLFELSSHLYVIHCPEILAEEYVHDMDLCYDL